MNVQKIRSDKLVKLNKNRFYKKGYSFAGWSKSNKGKVLYKNCQKVKNICKPGQKIKLYAKWNKVGKRRAIILGETSTKAVPINDVKSMNSLMKSSKYYGEKMNSVVYYPNHTKKQITAKIKSVFKNNKSNDISYIYMTSHGDEHGNIYIGSDDTYYSVTDLRKLLDKCVRGKVVLFVDCCYSGKLLSSKNASNCDNTNVFEEHVNVADEFVNTFINYDNPEIKGFSSNKYKVFCSSRSNEVSYGGEKASLATKYWTKGSGWDELHNKTCKLFADSNKDNKVTMKELYNYSYKNVKNEEDQHVVVYPKNSSFVIFGRFN